MAAYFVAPTEAPNKLFPGVHVEAPNPQAAVQAYLALPGSPPVAAEALFAVCETPTYVVAHVGVTLENVAPPALPPVGE
jgi:hypothetical protein